MWSVKSRRFRRRKTVLKQKRVERTKKPGRYRDGDVKGLYLQISDSGAKSYVLRYQRGTKETMLGLGSASEHSLKSVRERALAARRQLSDGVDPLAAKREKRAATKAAEARRVTFKQAAERYFDQHESKWTNASHRDAFLSTLGKYAFPVLGGMDVSAITLSDVLRVLEPQWNERAVTLDRVRNRIEAVLDSAKARGERDGENPAAWSLIGKVLPAARDVAPVAHHPAMPYAQLPAFMAGLRKQETVAARALEFLILTAARSGEVREAEWSEIDFEQKTWTVPAQKMKAGREHRTPLSDAVLALLRALPREEGNPRVFVGRAGAGLHKMSMVRVMELLGQRGQVTLHGFRSSFRDWAGETTAFAHDICEAALAHARGDATVRAYARGDLFDKRRRLMDAWSAYCASPARAGGDVAKLRGNV
jgi:integrase